MEFKCDKCGLCCQSLRSSNLYKDLDDGTGVCRYFDKDTRLCTIYANRPEKCSVEKMYKYFADTYTYEEYIRLNTECCEKLKERHGKGESRGEENF